MKIECVPRPQIQITFEYEELKNLSTSIETVISFLGPTNPYKASIKLIEDFLTEINKVL